MTAGSESWCRPQLSFPPLLLSFLLNSRGLFGSAGGAHAGGDASRCWQTGGRLHTDFGRAGLVLSPYPTGGSSRLGKCQERRLMLEQVGEGSRDLTGAGLMFRLGPWQQEGCGSTGRVW